MPGVTLQRLLPQEDRSVIVEVNGGRNTTLFTVSAPIGYYANE
jgi:hypothetical protein